MTGARGWRRLSAVSGVALAAVAVGGTLVPAWGSGGGVLSIVAGTGSTGVLTPGPATSANLTFPGGLAVDGAGDVYIALPSNRMVAKVSPTGTLSIVAGNGSFGAPTAGPATSSRLYNPLGVALDGAGNLYIADGASLVEKVTPAGTLSIFAGNGSSGPPTPGPATSSRLGLVTGVAVDSSGNVYISDATQHVVDKVSPGGTLSIFAGTGTAGAFTPGPATSSRLNAPYAVAVDSAGDVFIADVQNLMVAKVTPAGMLSVLAGTGTDGVPTAGPATSSSIGAPYGLTVDSGGNVFIADNEKSVVEKVTPAGALSIFAGTGQPSTPIAGPATSSPLDGPGGLATDSAGDVYVATNTMVVKVSAPPAGQSVTETVNGASLGFVSAPGAVSPPSTTLNGVNEVTPSFAMPLDIGDATGSGAGWNVSLNATPFTDSHSRTLGRLYEGTEPAPTCDASTTCTAATDATHLVSAVNPLTYGSGNLVQVADGATGMGNQSASPSFTLAVPANSYAGVYTSTWTVSLNTGP